MHPNTKIINLLLALLVTTHAYSSTHNNFVVDVYRSNYLNAKSISKKYQTNLNSIADAILASNNLSDPKKAESFTKHAELILKELQKKGDFSYLNISPTFYPGNKKIYITIDAVDKKDSDRLPHFLTKPTGTFKDPDHLIESWHEYEAIGMKLVQEDNTWKTVPVCPAYHCLFGFNHPKLKKYQIIFDKLVPKNQDQLFKILKNDKDEHKRAAAAYLLAHIKNGHKLITNLIPALDDANEGVRNNAMRVLGSTLAKVKDADFPVDKILIMLDSPVLTDRNKAAYIISSLVEQQRYATYVAAHAGTLLLAELKMRQLNVHELAYLILKKISNKNYRDRDYKSWSLWLKTHESSKAS